MTFSEMSADELDEMFTASEISVQGSVAAGFEKVTNRESSSLLNKIKKGKQQDHPDNGLKSIRFTGPGQDFGNAATAASKVYIMIS